MSSAAHATSKQTPRHQNASLERSNAIRGWTTAAPTYLAVPQRPTCRLVASSNKNGRWLVDRCRPRTAPGPQTNPGPWNQLPVPCNTGGGGSPFWPLLTVLADDGNDYSHHTPSDMHSHKHNAEQHSGHPTLVFGATLSIGG